MRCKNGQTKLYQLNITQEIKGRGYYEVEVQVNEQHCQPAFLLQPGTQVSRAQKNQAPGGDGNTLVMVVALLCPSTWFALDINSKRVIPWHLLWIQIEEDNVNHRGTSLCTGRQKMLSICVLVGEGGRIGRTGTHPTRGCWEIQNNGSSRVS